MANILKFEETPIDETASKEVRPSHSQHCEFDHQHNHNNKSEVIPTHSDGVPVEISTAREGFAHLKQSFKMVKALPASFYEQFLSRAAKERLPSPSEFIIYIYVLRLTPFCSP
jgi:hypothetical protein